jgi:hypothetical protein
MSILAESTVPRLLGWLLIVVWPPCRRQSCVSGLQAGGQGPSPHRLHTPCNRMARRRPARGLARPTGEARDGTDDAPAQDARWPDRARWPHERHTGGPGTGSALPAGESVRSPQPVPPACTAGLRPGGRRCWMCGQEGRADPPQTLYFYCDGCDVRWYGGTRRLRHSPEFTQREYTWWIAGGLAHIRYIDHAAEHTASPA